MSADMSIIGILLIKNNSLREIDLSHCNLSSRSVALLVDGLVRNQKIKKVNLSNNKFGVIILLIYRI
jgi:Ran GTPase-activating protein (RanGAP) involved in mRNA processing and transport